jgi:hypothetical protein
VITMIVPWHRRPVPRGAVGLGVVGETGHRRSHHRQHAEDHRDVGGLMQAHDVRDDRDGQRADRTSVTNAWTGWPEPRSVEEMLDRPIRWKIAPTSGG